MALVVLALTKTKTRPVRVAHTVAAGVGQTVFLLLLQPLVPVAQSVSSGLAQVQAV
jgi:hypothetical protein